ncbi:hypothetical protein [Celeribacter sp. PS-C1]|uniref:hypothetical protein n=1 Tax=Celeribacter sp. PS-C1 TaxID=2820813 RepID=UPI001CA4B89D|nr:hypothetical protein [Celeribacter sp. PS-C1]MBW6418656.1 hypothetical protein [Celeribacter sp. PS-C1]
MRFFTPCFTLALLSSTAGAHAFCDDILATQVLCVTEEAEEIKLCGAQHPETGAPAFELHVTPQISDGPLTQLAIDTPFDMTPGTGGYPWDSYSLTFLHEGGRAVLNIQTPIDGGGAGDTEIWLELYHRNATPIRTLSCLTPALSAEVADILTAREIALNSFRTGPSRQSAAYYQPRMPLVGAAPYGGAECREVSGVLSNEGTDNGQIVLYAAPFEEAAILGYISPYALENAFECDFDNGFSGIIWTDPEKGDGAGGYMSELDYDAKLEACGLTPEGWPTDVAYLGKCSSAWVREGNVAGFEP